MLTPAVRRVEQVTQRRVDLGDSLLGVGVEGGELLALEGDGLAFRVVLVVGHAELRSGEDLGVRTQRAVAASHGISAGTRQARPRTLVSRTTAHESRNRRAVDAVP